MGARNHPDVKRLEADLARCNQEIAAIDAGATCDENQRAFVVCLGREDWLRERTLIENELRKYGD